MERIALIVSNETRKTIGFMIVDVMELDYVAPKVIFYVEKGHGLNKTSLQAILDTLGGSVVKVSDLRFALEKWAYNERERPLYDLTDFIEFVSSNKNKSIRNKRAITELGMNVNNTERIVIKHGGKKITTHLY